MKKIYLLAALAFGTLLNANSQTVVFSSSLESWAGSPAEPTDMSGSKTNFATDSIIQVTGSSMYGSNAARLKNTTTTHKRFTTQPMTVVNGTTYEIKFWVKGQGEIRTGMFDGRATGFGYATYGSYITVNSSSWTMYSQNVTCANDTTDGEFILSVRSTVGSDHMMVDSIAIVELSSTPVNATIYQIQYTTSTPANSPYNGMNVNTGGIVTGYYSNGYFVQSGTGAWNGVMVYDTVNSPVSGDSITFTAMVEEYFSNTRLTSVTGYSLVSAGNTVPNPEVITTTQGNTEDYEGCLVKATAPCSDDNAGFGMWTIYSAPDSLKIDNLMYSFTPTVGLTYEVIGCIEYSFSEFKLN
ncbi:MAG TPA: carbohydrate binding domain-containing protein, partial [Flavobacteriales bacterium]|nr:carbohydrate binding domain-containing protein [Flavobacteriales bacterium]